MAKCLLWKPEDPSAISNTHTKGAALPAVAPGDGVGEMAQWSRVLAALPKALGSDPHQEAHPCNSDPGDLASVGTYTCVLYTQASIYT